MDGCELWRIHEGGIIWIEYVADFGRHPAAIQCEPAGRIASMYRVLSATVIRTTLVLKVLPDGLRRSDGGRYLEVDGQPERKLEVRGGRVLFERDDTISDDRLVFCDLPDFPANELVGQKLIPVTPVVW
jgi:hypothetical protein